MARPSPCPPHSPQADHDIQLQLPANKDQAGTGIRDLGRRTIRLDQRVAGALVLLYGNPLSRTAQLTADHIQQRPDGCYLHLDSSHPIRLPPTLASLVLRLRDTATPGSPLGRVVAAKKNWLFPSTLPAAHAGTGHLSTRLNAYGIQARSARVTALMSLAAELPAAILADLLGLHINTAVTWTKLAGRDWLDYVATRFSGPSSTGIPQQTK
ncbi:hypothetical protein [Actinomadura sp. 6N118]|uniref:hypothetical protein n=1 Tax=Actinomadura sp. 6N118 TaxID=3375151 RepID=UPI0037878B51